MELQERLQTGELMWIAHRGASEMCPENTLPAFAKAVQLGADMLELDVRLTRDNQVVVIHDVGIQRTTNGTGLISELTLEEIRKYDAGSWFAPEFRGATVPTLNDVLTAWPDALLNVELKTSPTMHANKLVRHVLECIHRHQAQHRVLLSSFDHVALQQARHEDDDIALGALYSGRLWDPFRLAESLRLSSFHPDVEHLDRPFVEEANTQGYAVLTWTVVTPDVLRWALYNHVDGVIVNDIRLKNAITATGFNATDE